VRGGRREQQPRRGGGAGEADRIPRGVAGGKYAESRHVLRGSAREANLPRFPSPAVALGLSPDSLLRNLSLHQVRSLHREPGYSGSLPREEPRARHRFRNQPGDAVAGTVAGSRASSRRPSRFPPHRNRTSGSG